MVFWCGVTGKKERIVKKKGTFLKSKGYHFSLNRKSRMIITE